MKEFIVVVLIVTTYVFVMTGATVICSEIYSSFWKTD